MADVTVNASVVTAPQLKATRSQVFTTASIGYQFFVNGANDDLVYQKTTDGGATWGAAVTVRTGSVNGFDIWFDKWTPGDSGTVIHTWYCDNVARDLFYRSLDTSSDTLGSAITVLNGTVAGEELVSGAKARDGNLVVVYNLDGSTSGAFDSPDGVTWTAIASPHEGVADYFMLFPGNAADTRDMWLAFWDRSANEISLKTYDDSADSWSEDSIASSMTATTHSSTGAGWSGSIRHADNHLILVAASGRDTAGPVDDLKVWDINGGASITGLTNVITDKDDWYNPTIFIDQNNGDFYVGYNGKSDGSETLGTTTFIYYKKSTDDGSTWGSETAYSEGSGNFLALSGGLGGTATRFVPAFWMSSSSDLFVNVVNSVAIGAGGGGGSIAAISSYYTLSGGMR